MGIEDEDSKNEDLSPDEKEIEERERYREDEEQAWQDKEGIEEMEELWLVLQEEMRAEEEEFNKMPFHKKLLFWMKPFFDFIEDKFDYTANNFEEELDEPPESEKLYEKEELLDDEQAEWVAVSDLKNSITPGKPYFPKMFSEEEEADDFLQQSFARNLKWMQEPILFLEDHPLVFRFLWWRSFDAPMSFRFYQSGNGEYHFVVKMRSGQGVDPGEMVIDKDIKLPKEQGNVLLDKINECKFWNMQRHMEIGGLDGASWILEGMVDDRYHVVYRWCGDSSRINEICRMFMEYSGIKIDNIY